jgi:caa(3)-type oxidase subunit IV
MSVDTSHIDPVTGDYNGPMFDGHDIMYLKIAAGLFILTAIEVALSYSGLEHASLASSLMALAAIKFVIVAGYFMHLKFDSPLLRRLFIGGGLLAVFCYFGVMSAMGALRTPRALLPIHWWVYLIGFVAIVAVWVVPRIGGHDDHEGHDHGDHDVHDHSHDDHSHDDHAHAH